MGLKQGPGIRHWPLRSVAKKCGPASRISTHGREKWGNRERQELPAWPISPCTQPLLRGGQ